MTMTTLFDADTRFAELFPVIRGGRLTLDHKVDDRAKESTTYSITVALTLIAYDTLDDDHELKVVPLPDIEGDWVLVHSPMISPNINDFPAIQPSPKAVAIVPYRFVRIAKEDTTKSNADSFRFVQPRMVLVARSSLPQLLERVQSCRNYLTRNTAVLDKYDEEFDTDYRMLMDSNAVVDSPEDPAEA